MYKKRRGCNRPTATNCPAYVFRTQIQKVEFCFIPLERNSFIQGYVSRAFSWYVSPLEAGCVGELAVSERLHGFS